VTSPNFQTMASMASADLLIKPLLYRYFHEAEFPDTHTVTFRKEESEDRVPDGWFHPSEHSTKTARQLYHYLAEPEQWQGWRPDYTLRMSVLMGSAVHDFGEMALKHLGLLMQPSGTCVACGKPQPSECKEFGARDDETGSRGHMDGILRLAILGMGGFELKTCAPMVIRNIADGDVVAFRKKWPYYYAQIQEYMRMTGLPFYIVLFFGMGNPWEMREFKIEADLLFQQQTKNTYLAARRAFELGKPPEACCGPRSKQSRECPARGCEMARL
jgi:hypothetical protein